MMTLHFSDKDTPPPSHPPSQSLEEQVLQYRASLAPPPLPSSPLPPLTTPCPPTASSSSAEHPLSSFLLQRSLQTFMYLLNSVGDTTTSHYLSLFGSTPSLSLYHGLRGVPAHTLPGYLLSLLARADHTVLPPPSSRPRRPLGWSKNNPHAPPAPPDPPPLPISPRALAKRLLTVASHVSAEFEHDLSLIASQTEYLWSSYRASLRSSSPAAFAPVTAQVIDGDSLSDTASVLRGGSLDLLLLVTTEEAVRGVLREMGEGGTRSWLRGFYEDRQHMFNGPQPHHSAHAFLTQMLETPPSVRGGGGGGGGPVELLDPHRVVELVLEKRGEVCGEWVGELGGEGEVGKQIVGVRRSMMESMMEGTAEGTADVL
ncbi:hypothetical protein TeGR_g9852 [Tetraparma gracilis]|uniref:Uncharacterized protein n=1 Tax=Tetraparma gracilis TaxID=2962635 RepID=A0ABQ6MGJ7_9STRA|nr:hypothetical protein TeGR_g9852 [Tetraparma gracilis]